MKHAMDGLKEVQHPSSEVLFGFEGGTQCAAPGFNLRYGRSNCTSFFRIFHFCRLFKSPLQIDRVEFVLSVHTTLQAAIRQAFRRLDVASEVGLVSSGFAKSCNG